MKLSGKKRKRVRRIKPERARLGEKVRLRADVAPVKQPFSKAGLIVLHAFFVVLFLVSAFPVLPPWWNIAGIVLLVASFHYLFSLYLVRFHRERLERFNHCLAAVVLSIVMLGVARFTLWSSLSPAWIPLSGATLFFSLLLSQAVAFSASACLLLAIGLMHYAAGQEDAVAAMVILGAGAAMAALTVSRVRRRSTLIRVGLFIGLAHLLVSLGIALFQEGAGAWDGETLSQVFSYLVQGLLVGFLVSGLLPVIEYLFEVTTDVSLLELSNQNENLVLRKLLIDSPGTFHHSFIVGILAEAAAERIGAHGLLCRVGAYFHDIGKMNKPQYFAENADQDKSLHDDLSPEMSALIITSHTKDSLELADYYDLPSCLRAFMVEHHGTSRIEFFYNRALEKAREEGGQVDEEVFRYPGPKPQSKETAIVMLADAVEAAVRSLKKPTSARISALVRELVMDRLQGEQLDQCPLTLRDIRETEEEFTSVLIGIHHARPSYKTGDAETRRQARSRVTS